MTANAIMIGAAVAVLLSYWFSHLARRYRLPSVLLLLLCGLAARIATSATGTTVQVPPALISVLGTTGLMLIVFEGALDLHLDPGRRAFLLRTFNAAAVGLLLTTAALGVLLSLAFGLPAELAVLAAVPFGVISSAVAIPTAEVLGPRAREFVIYESSWSDILGVMLFNTLLVASLGGGVTLHLLGGGVAVLLIGLVLSLGVYWLVGHLEGNVKFIPLLFALILVYAAADALHLSPLLIVLILGLTLNNAHLLHRVQWLQRLHNEAFETELGRLKHLTSELTFVVRTFFFLLLGYVTDVRSMLDPQAWLYAAAIVTVVFAARWPTLRLAQAQEARQAFWIAPRGLITATLFLSLPAQLAQLLPPATLVLVVLLSGVTMAIGLRADAARAPAPA